MTKEALFQLAEQEFGVVPDYPWQERNAVLRHGGSRKWFGLVVELDRGRLGLLGQGKVEVLNVKGDPRIVGALKGQRVFSGLSYEQGAVAQHSFRGAGGGWADSGAIAQEL